MILTERKTPMPVKITLAGEKTCNTYMRDSTLTLTQIKTHQTDAPGDGGRKRVEDIDSWAQPLCQSLIAGAVFLEFPNLIAKDSKYGSS